MDVVFWYLKDALSAVNNHWGKNLIQQSEFVSHIVTRTDEAFVLWTLETSADSWIQLYDADGNNNVAEGRSKGGDDDVEEEDEVLGQNRFGSEASMEMYEKMIGMVEDTRNSVHCADWDRQVQAYFRDKMRKPTRLPEKKSRTTKKRKYEKNFDMLVDNF